MTLTDTYFPLATGPGATASEARWNLLASALLPNGVIEGRYNQLNPTLGGSTLSIDTGAVWINGVYAEDQNIKTMTVASNGIIVARLDLTAQTISYVQIANSFVGVNSSTQIDVPVAAMVSGTLQDWRQFTAPNRPRPGTMEARLSPVLPAGGLLLYGQTISRTQYARLFNSNTVQNGLGTTFGTGDGSTTFTVPDMRGYIPAGLDNMGGSAAGRLAALTTLGETTGSGQITLLYANLPSHTHTITDPGHVHGYNDPGHVHAVSDPGHTHIPSNGQSVVAGPNAPDNNWHLVGNGGTALVGQFDFDPLNSSQTGASLVNATTGVSIQVAFTNISSAYAGGGTAFNAAQPTYGVNWIIWT